MEFAFYCVIFFIGQTSAPSYKARGKIKCKGRWIETSKGKNGKSRNRSFRTGKEITAGKVR